MTWTIPGFSKGNVDSAGRILAGVQAASEENIDSLIVLNNWRSSHSFPLNTFQNGLRKRARQIDTEALVAQRLKRVPSIVQKLIRYPSMRLSRMQDIGGCRAVLASIEDAMELREVYLHSGLKHTLVNEKNYILTPKESGYRGIHLVYRYRSDRNHTYNGHLIEIQIRSQIQHAWATAVETVGTFLQHSLKSSEGPEKWLQFFSIMGSAFAHLEKTLGVPGTPLELKDLTAKAKKMASELDVQNKLRVYGDALRTYDEDERKGTYYYLLALIPSEGSLQISAYRKDQLNQATTDYLETEKRFANLPGAEAVLVAAESLDSLRKAYPNYFLDTQVFLEKLEEIIN